MRRQNEGKGTWALAGACLFVFFALVCMTDGISDLGDYIFLHNRCVQMKECLSHLEYPFLYYEDAGGIGYGSPIFYGQLTLVPFMLFIGNIDVFVKMYLLACLFLNFFGFRCFLKRISSQATLGSCYYLTSLAFVCLMGSSIPAFVMAVGFSWFFFAFCVDYFRDGRSFCLVILTYFMIWQSNLNAVILSSIICVGIFVFYFRRDRIKDYVRLFVCTILTVLYNIVNILVHRDAITLVDPSHLLSLMKPGGEVRELSITPFGSLMCRLLTHSDCCCGFMSFVLWVAFVYYITSYFKKESRRFKIGSYIIGVVFIVGYIIGVQPVWEHVYKLTNLFFQFPIRYYIFLFGFVLAIFSRVVRPDKGAYFVVVCALIDILLINPFVVTQTVGDYHAGMLMGNREYASNSFVADTDVYEEYRSSVHSASGRSYSFDRRYNLVTVECDTNLGDDTLTLPKLYYKGYQARGSNGERFKVVSGYSNYCEVFIGDFTGTLTLYYSPPLIVSVCFVLQFVLVSCWLVLLVHNRRGSYALAKGE